MRRRKYVVTLKPHLKPARTIKPESEQNCVAPGSIVTPNNKPSQFLGHKPEGVEKMQSINLKHIERLFSGSLDDPFDFESDQEELTEAEIRILEIQDRIMGM